MNGKIVSIRVQPEHPVEHWANKPRNVQTTLIAQMFHPALIAPKARWRRIESRPCPDPSNNRTLTHRSHAYGLLESDCTCRRSVPLLQNDKPPPPTRSRKISRILAQPRFNFDLGKLDGILYHPVSQPDIRTGRAMRNRWNCRGRTTPMGGFQVCSTNRRRLLGGSRDQGGT